jgi:hypothetical protein
MGLETVLKVEMIRVSGRPVSSLGIRRSGLDVDSEPRFGTNNRIERGLCKKISPRLDSNLNSMN